MTTGVTAEIRQRIFEHYFVGVAGGYDNRDYRAAESVVSTSRNDNYGLVRVVAGVQWIERWTVSVFYQSQTNGSNEGIHDFYDNKVGLQSSWGF